MLWLLWVVLVGLIAGWATGKIMKGSGYGPLMDIALGIVGGVIGGWIMNLLGFYTSGGLIPSILVAILGAVVLVALLRMLKRAVTPIGRNAYLVAGRSRCSSPATSRFSASGRWLPNLAKCSLIRGISASQP